MRTRINALILRPRSWVVALTAFAALAVPASASASAAVAVASFPQTRTITNQATASTQRNGHTDWVLKYQLQRQASAATLNVSNHATATASQCRNCTADGIAFQVVVASMKNLVTLNADNEANALSSNCVRCNSFAGAYQVIYASNQPRLSLYQIRGLNRVRSELIALRFTGLQGDALQANLDAIADDAVSALDNDPNPIPVITPAVGNSPSPAALTRNSGPYIDLFVKVRHPGS